MRGSVKSLPSTRGNSSRRIGCPSAMLCTCNRGRGKRAGCVLPVHAEALRAMVRRRRQSRWPTDARAFSARTAPIGGEGPRSYPGTRGSQKSSLLASGYEPVKFRRGIGFQDGNQRRSMLRPDPNRVQHAGLALPNRMAGKLVTKARQLIAAVHFQLLNLRPDLFSRGNWSGLFVFAVIAGLAGTPVMRWCAHRVILRCSVRVCPVIMLVLAMRWLPRWWPRCAVSWLIPRPL